MLFISAKVELASAQEAARYAELASAIVEPTRAEKGCNLYAFSRDVSDDKVIWISEEWESEEDLTAHLKTQHIADFLVAIADVNMVAMDDRKYEISSVGHVIMPDAE
jgi:quinol monooxygenase YgiN